MTIKFMIKSLQKENFMKISRIESNHTQSFKARFSPEAEAYITNAIKTASKDEFVGQHVAETAHHLKKLCEYINPRKEKNDIVIRFDRLFYLGSDNKKGYSTSSSLSEKLSDNKNPFDILKTLSNTVTKLKEIQIRESSRM